MEAVRKYADALGPQKLWIMGGVAAALVLALAWLTIGRSEGSYAYLYSDLDPAGARAVTEKLTQANVPFQLSPDGTAVLAPADRLPELRMMLAGDQLGGKIGYEILDAEDAFGTSASKAKINQTRAIEGELARSIETLTAVSRARVHLVMPERTLFTSQSRPATASITLRTSGRLSAQQVSAIRSLVASAVPELQPERISIVDQSGTLLARAGDDAAAMGGALDERQIGTQTRLREQVEAMLEKVVGPGHARAEVAAEIDFDQVREEADIFDPENSVITKQTRVEHSNEDSEQSASGGPVSVATALPENTSSATDDGNDARRSAMKDLSEETTFDNSRRRTTRINAGGEIKRLTVSVMIDGSYREGSNGNRVYVPRTAAEIERITRLVENAIGYDEARGDSVVVENIRFAEPEAVETGLGGLPINLARPDLQGLVRTLVLGLLALVALVLVVRPLLRRSADVSSKPSVLDRGILGRPAAGDADALAQLQAQQGVLPALEHEIDVAQVEGRLKASALRKVGEVVDRNPGEAVAIIRQWMYS